MGSPISAGHVRPASGPIVVVVALAATMVWLFLTVGTGPAFAEPCNPRVSYSQPRGCGETTERGTGLAPDRVATDGGLRTSPNASVSAFDVRPAPLTVRVTCGPASDAPRVVVAASTQPAHTADTGIGLGGDTKGLTYTGVNTGLGIAISAVLLAGAGLLLAVPGRRRRR